MALTPSHKKSFNSRHLTRSLWVREWSRRHIPQIPNWQRKAPSSSCRRSSEQLSPKWVRIIQITRLRRFHSLKRNLIKLHWQRRLSSQWRQLAIFQTASFRTNLIMLSTALAWDNRWSPNRAHISRFTIHHKIFKQSRVRKSQLSIPTISQLWVQVCSISVLRHKRHKVHQPITQHRNQNLQSSREVRHT